MTHELKNILFQAIANQNKGLKSVLATVVNLDGSSYRKPGVRMLICEDGSSTGAVSGGCIEKEIINQAHSVFQSGKAKMMTYDGRYRLGCEGVLYILIEPFYVSDDLYEKFHQVLKLRQEFKIDSYYLKQEIYTGDFGSKIVFNDQSSFNFTENFTPANDLQVFSQTLKPPFKLIIIGSEHDAVKLCLMASLLGWEIEVITSWKDPKELRNFPGAKIVSAKNPDDLDLVIDDETALVLMTHNYALDLKYLIKLQNNTKNYVGILGSIKRREHLLNEIIEMSPDISEEFLDNIYSPAGLNIGAITPEEIALSILSEILAVTRQKDASQLRNVNTENH